jgi:hypothetical protein
MSMSMIPLLMVSDSISAEAREALRAVVKAPAHERAEKRVAAARLLFNETDLACDEVKDLMGLSPTECSC